MGGTGVDDGITTDAFLRQHTKSTSPVLRLDFRYRRLASLHGFAILGNKSRLTGSILKTDYTALPQEAKRKGTIWF
jgi:hypothetical protein